MLQTRKLRLTPLLLSILLVSCQGGQPVDLQPIPGSITYGGQPRQRLVKSPSGSTFSHIFYDQMGRRTEETYQVQPDRSLKLIERHYIIPPL